MKDKKIIAMFVTSAVALVASVVITLGIAFTLADPVPAQSVPTCVFNFGGVNETKVKENANALVYENAIVFQPSGSTTVNDWDMNSDTHDSPVSFLKDQKYTDTIMYVDETYPSKVKLVAFKVTNSTSEDMEFTVAADYNKTSSLGKYIQTALYDFEYEYHTDSTEVYSLAAGESAEFVMVIYVDTSTQTDGAEIVWTQDSENISVVVTKV